MEAAHLKKRLSLVIAFLARKKARIAIPTLATGASLWHPLGATKLREKNSINLVQRWDYLVTARRVFGAQMGTT